MNYWSNGIPLPSGVAAAEEIEITWDVLGPVLTVNLNYGGSAASLPYDNEIRIWLTSDIKSVTGADLDNYMYYFTTRYSPIYCDISQVFTRVGGIIGEDFPEDIIYRLLLRYSILSDMINPEFAYNNIFNWRMVRNEWILCSTVRDLLLNMPSLSGISGGSKRLADLSVGQQVAKNSAVLQEALNCVAKFEELMSEPNGAQIRVAVRGSQNPEEPNLGRRISNYMHSTVPIVNTAWVYDLRATTYSTARMIRKILGNYRSNIGL